MSCVVSHLTVGIVGRLQFLSELAVPLKINVDHMLKVTRKQEFDKVILNYTLA